MNGQSGKTSASFIIAIVLAVAAVGGYVAVRLWPNDVKRSEWIVREFNQGAGQVYGEFKRALRELKAETEKRAADPAANTAAIDTRVAEAHKRVDDLAEKAHSSLDDLGNVPLRTHRNRGDRVDEKADETKAAIAEEAARAKGL